MEPYIPHTDQDLKEMLETIDVENVESLFSTIPSEKVINSIDLPNGMDEFNVLSKLRKMALTNASADKYAFFIGGGIYNHVIPSAVNQIASRGDFYTAYTPYQAEVSQGTLQSLFEFQTMICEITGMGIANASMYDGASSLAEAVLMASRYTQKYRMLVADTIHPEYIETVKTYVAGPKIEIEKISHDSDGKISLKDLKSKIDDKTSCVVVQYPNFYGVIEDLKSIRGISKDVILIVVSNPISLGILEAPGKLGADVVVGDGQTLGISMNFGGPSFGFFAIREDTKFVRTMPGRIIGETVDVDGKRGFVMTLQAREQHIRREKATSNICSNHALGTLYASIYLSLVGPKGLKEIGELNISKSHYLLKRLEKTGHFVRAFSGEFFNEFVVKTDLDISKMKKVLFKNGIIGPLDLSKANDSMKGHVLFCATESNTSEEIEKLISVLEVM
ncbi:MAG: aminomethyl-transferring glycine dehydrogenase subunit GcvPA [Thermotogae bacterium]|jgi:glycine dehydrogenase subunit 1|nr:aminomethyl-transferring glycine dehydrogenase subunit GcvPA [Thermotogota bacterium]